MDDQRGPVELLATDVLEQSAVVANCAMNRERQLTGVNSYTRELGFNPDDVLAAAAAGQPAGQPAGRLPYRYFGADDRAGANYTGQPAVHSYYAYEP